MPAGDVGVGRFVGDFEPEGVVLDALWTVDVESNDVILSRRIELTGLPLVDDPLVGSGIATANHGVAGLDADAMPDLDGTAIERGQQVGSGGGQSH